MPLRAEQSRETRRRLLVSNTTHPAPLSVGELEQAEAYLEGQYEIWNRIQNFHIILSVIALDEEHHLQVWTFKSQS